MTNCPATMKNSAEIDIIATRIVTPGSDVYDRAGSRITYPTLPGTEEIPPDPEALRRAVEGLACRPRSVRTVERIDRSETGKLRRVQSAQPHPEGVHR